VAERGQAPLRTAEPVPKAGASLLIQDSKVKGLAGLEQTLYVSRNIMLFSVL